MKRAPLLLALLCLLPLAGGSAVAESIFPYPYTKEVLPNGLTVYMIPMASPGLVAYYSVVRTGSRDEVEPGKSGFAHFFEHMMFRGTKKYPGHIYDSVMTAIGADANAYTTDDYTAYHLKFAKEDLEKVVEMESDRFQNLQYAKPEFQTEAGAVYGEYRKSITQPFMLLSEKMQNLAYDVHTYKHTTIGFEDDIKAMPEQYEYSLSFFNRFYRPENVVLVIAGDLDPAATLALVKRFYGDWKKGYTAPAVTPEPPQSAERRGLLSGTDTPAHRHRLQGGPLRSGQPALRRLPAAGGPRVRTEQRPVQEAGGEGAEGAVPRLEHPHEPGPAPLRGLLHGEAGGGPCLRAGRGLPGR
jgi:zinc protease